MKKIAESETRIIKRSEIDFSGLNPKEHSEEAIRQQLKNFKQNGFLGGIVWNERTGELIAGHKRIYAMDLYYRYDGTEKTDYEVKVEVVDMDEKTALEQMTFMSGITDTRPDYNKIAAYIDDIDFASAGITESDYHAIQDLKDVGIGEDITAFGTMELMEEEFAPKPEKKESVAPEEQESNDTAFTPPVIQQPKPSQAPIAQTAGQSAPVFELNKEKSIEQIQQEHNDMPHATKEEIVGKKETYKSDNNKYMDNVERYIILRFDTYEDKSLFCEALGLQNKDNMVVDGMDMLGRFNEDYED